MSAPPSEAVEVMEGKRRWCVIEGDCTQILPTLPERSVDHVLADPPYSEHVHAVGQVRKKAGADYRIRESFGFDAIAADEMRACAESFARLARRWVLVFCDVESAGLWRGDLVGAGLDGVRIGVWVKPDAMPQLTGDRPSAGFEAVVIAHHKGRKQWNGGGRPAVWAHHIERSDREHPTQKPLSLMLELVSLFTDPGDLILDSHAGVSTTGVAAIRLGRRFVGIERNPRFATLSRARLEAESRGLSLHAAQAGQTSLFGAS